MMYIPILQAGHYDGLETNGSPSRGSLGRQTQESIGIVRFDTTPAMSPIVLNLM